MLLIEYQDIAATLLYGSLEFNIRQPLVQRDTDAQAAHCRKIGKLPVVGVLANDSDSGIAYAKIQQRRAQAADIVSKFSICYVSVLRCLFPARLLFQDEGIILSVFFGCIVKKGTYMFMLFSFIDRFKLSYLYIFSHFPDPFFLG